MKELIFWKSNLWTKYALVLGMLMISVGAFSQLPTAGELASEMTVGINIGNTLEASGGETAWGNPMVNQQYIDAVKAAGFNTIRIPCSWDQYANQGTLEIDPSWMARVTEVVDYCMNQDLYVVLNIHWDGGWLENNVNQQQQSAVNIKQEDYWTQIANNFRDYDEHLLFASANEPNVSNATEMSVLLSYHQTFVDAVRATGGNNSSRTLIVQGPNTDIDATNQLMTSLPTDQIANRMMVEVHYYSPYQFCLMSEDASWGNMFYYWGQDYHSTVEPERNATWGEEDYLDGQFNLMQQQFVNNGIPVIIGEWGAYKRSGTLEPSLHEASVEYYDKYLVESALAHGLIPYYWDTGGLINRNTGAVLDQGVLDAIMEGNACTPTDIVPYVQVNGASWQQTGNVTLNTGSTVVFGPQPSGGAWSWSGPNGFTASTREVTISNIQSNQAGNYIATYTNDGGCESSQTFTVTVTAAAGGGTGTILREYWTGISGTSISNLISNANYPNSPSGSGQLTSLEGPTNWDDNYGTRIRGYIHPTTSGSYTFWLAGDDATELYLSTDANPTNMSRIAYIDGWTNSREWTKYSTQQSSSINLMAGQKYYVEVIHKEGGGGDNLAVAWQGPGISQQVISGSYLSPYISDAIVVRARGVQGDETIDLRVDGNTVASWTLTTSFANYTAAGNGAVTVHFTNDNGGRDVQVDYVSINGTTYQSENQATNTGVWQNNTCGGSNSEWLQCNGYISYASGSSSRTGSVESEGLEEVVLSADEVNVYPNPACEGKFSIEFPETSRTVSINIFDMQGKMLYERVFTGGGRLNVDSGLKSGIYSVKARSEGLSFTKKLIVR